MPYPGSGHLLLLFEGCGFLGGILRISLKEIYIYSVVSHGGPLSWELSWGRGRWRGVSVTSVVSLRCEFRDEARCHSGKRLTQAEVNENGSSGSGDGTVL